MTMDFPNYQSESDLDADITSLTGPIAVFGAGGFIGANLFRRILNVRQDCFGMTHQSYTPWRLLGTPSKNIVRCDITDSLALHKLVQRYGFQSYFCFAAFGAYARQTDRIRIYDTNFLGLARLLETAEARGFSSFVHAGSSSEYGLNASGPKETDALQPNSDYAVSKVAASYLIQFAGKQKGLPIINLRYYSVYGPWEESDRLVSRLVESGLRGRLPQLVTPTTMRDFIYVGDAVEAAILGATRGTKAAPGASLNIASGQKTTLQNLVSVAKQVFSIREEPVWGAMPNRAWDTDQWYGDPQRAKSIIGWSARTSLEEGLSRTAEWMKKSGTAPKIVPELDSESPVRLSAVVCCYRDGEAIPIMHERLTKVFNELGTDYEIIFVNDGSPDDSRSVLARLCAQDPHVVAIEHTRNFGSQSAFLSGMEIASGHAVVLLDGDLQDPPELIAKFYEKWREGYEVVYGTRVRRDAPALRQVAYKAFYRIFQRLAYVPIPLDAGDFSLIDAKVVKHLIRLPETNQFLRGLRAWVGFRQTGVDYVRPERMFGTTTNSWRKNFWWARKAIFNFSFLPLEALWYLGTGVFILAFLGFLAQVIYRLFHPEIPHGVTTIVLVVLFFGGTGTLMFSILGEYLSKVFEEAKRRPKFIRRGILTGSMELKPDD